MPAERRVAKRRTLHWDAVIADTAGAVVSKCDLDNVSATGAKLVLPKPLKVPDRFVLVLSKGGNVQRHCHVEWRNGNELGVRFVHAMREGLRKRP
jgi:hypothetical protein